MCLPARISDRTGRPATLSVLLSITCGMTQIRLIALAAVLAGCSFGNNSVPAPGGCPSGLQCSASPVMVTGGHRFTSLTAGRYHTCGVTATGAAWCWGLNTGGQLGATTIADRSGIPLLVGGQTPFTSITAGEFHTCAIGQDGGAYCWGTNVTSVLGVADVPGSTTPVRAVGSLTFAIFVAAMTAGRWFGPGLLDRHGRVPVLRGSVLLALPNRHPLLSTLVRYA